MKIIDRYILKELWGPFVNGVFAFTAILVAGFILPKLVDLLTGPQAIGIREVGLVFLYRLPSVLVITFPMSTLLGALQGFSRLSGDSETIVMQSGGIPFTRMMRWVFIMGALISVGTLWFNEALVPASNSRAEDIIRASGRNAQPTSALVVQDWQDGRLERVVIARSLDTTRNQLHGVTMLQYQNNQVVGIVNAKTAQWMKELGKWEFRQGYTQRVSSNGPQGGMRFSQMILEFTKRPEEVKLSERKPDAMTYDELRGYIARLKLAGVDVREFQVKLHHKIALPMACLVFILIGAPLGLRPHRGGAAIGFGLAIMIAFFYYVFAHFLAAAAEGGTIAPATAAWIPDIVGAVIGTALIAKAAR